MDGDVIIGIQLDTKQLEADLKNAKKELSQFQKEEEKLLREKGEVELDLSEYEELIEKVDKANQKVKELKKERKKLFTDGKISANDYGTYESLTAEIQNAKEQQNILVQQVQKMETKYLDNVSKVEEINDKLKNNAVQQGVVNNKIEEANKKLSQAKGYKNVEEQIGKISDKTSNVVKQVGRWALAIFSVRSAYSFLSRASSTLAQYNKEYGANLEYIRYVLAQALAPVLQFLVNLAFKLLTYINYIAQAWFGINLFSNASVKNFQKMAGSAASIKKSLQTAGFDEMNVLSDTSSSSGGAGAGIPSLDLAKPEDVPIPSWLQWIADNKDIVIAGLLGIAAGLIAIHLGLSLIQGLGIGLVVAGLVLLIQDILDFIKDPTWEKFGEILTDIGIILAGLALIFGSIPLAIAALIAVIVGLVITNWDKIKEILGKVGSWIWDNIIVPVGEFFSNLWNGIKEGASKFWEGTKEIFSKIGDWIWNKIISPVAKFFKDLWNGIVDGVTKAVDKVKTIFNTVKTFFQNIIKNIISLFVTIGTKVGDGISKAFKTVVNAVLAGVENILNFPINAINGLINVINSVPRN